MPCGELVWLGKPSELIICFDMMILLFWSIIRLKIGLTQHLTVQVLGSSFATRLVFWSVFAEVILQLSIVYFRLFQSAHSVLKIQPEVRYFFMPSPLLSQSRCCFLRSRTPITKTRRNLRLFFSRMLHYKRFHAVWIRCSMRKMTCWCVLVGSLAILTTAEAVRTLLSVFMIFLF